MYYSLNTNINALNAVNATRASSDKLNTSLQRLSTGLRINNSVDDSAGLIEANRLRSDSDTLKEAIRNGNNITAMFQIMDKAIDQQINILDNIKVKAIQAATDGQNKISREALQKEIEDLLKELDNIAKTTSFGDQKLLDGTFTNKKVNIGLHSSDNMNFSFASTSSDRIGYSSYRTTDIGERKINNLELTFKNSGQSKEDVTLAPFTLSSSPGKTIKDLANFVNKYTEDTGVRAVYKEGDPLPVFKKNKFKDDLAKEAEEAKEAEQKGKPALEPTGNLPLTTSTYLAKDFKAVDKVKVSNISFRGNSTEKNNIKKDDIVANDDIIYNIDFRAETRESSLITPAGKTFRENYGNNQLFSDNTLTMQLSDDEFNNILPKDFITAENLPDYLKFNFTPIDSRTYAINLSKNGSEAIPTKYADLTGVINNINLKFDDKGFKSGTAPSDLKGFNLVYGKDKDDLKVKFNVVGHIKETSFNQGQYSGYTTLELQGGTFSNVPGGINMSHFSFTDSTNYPWTTAPASINIDTAQTTNNKIVFKIKDTLGGIGAHKEDDDMVINIGINNSNIIAGHNPARTTSIIANADAMHTYIDFQDRPTLSIDRSFTEHPDNDGKVATSIVIKIEGDKFADNLSDADLASKIKINKQITSTSIPADLELSYTQNNSNEITVTFKRSATANNTPFTITDIVLDQDMVKRSLSPFAYTTDFDINFFADPNVQIKATTSFTETILNDGSVSGPLVLELVDGVASFNPTNIKDYIDMALPDGLTPSFEISTNHQSLSIFLDGEAKYHETRREPINIGFKQQAFNPQSFATKIDAFIDFSGSANLVASGNFQENDTFNNGSIAEPIDIDVKNGETIATAIGTTIDPTKYSLTGLPNGLTSTLTVVNDKQFQLTLGGQAGIHVDVQSLNLSIDGEIFTSGIKPNNIDSLKIEFKKPSSIIQIGEFRESASNNGKIASKVTYELTSGTFKDAGILITDIPPGLNAEITFDATKPKILIVELKGIATTNNSFTEAAIKINFTPALAGTPPPNDTSIDSVISKINFVDALPKFKKIYGDFVENEKNIGQIKGEVGLEIPSGLSFNIDGYTLTDEITNPVHPTTGVKLSRYLAKFISNSGVPDILKPRYRIDPFNDKRLLVSFIQEEADIDGNIFPSTALNHGVEDSTKFRLSFNSDLFHEQVNVDDISLDITFYNDPEVISFGYFKESSRNDGSTNDYVKLSVLGDSFAKVNPNNYITVKGIPNSLIPKFTRDGTSLRFYLEGRVNKHDDFDDLNNIELVFNKRLFENQIDAQPLKNLRFDFKNKPILKLVETFKESFSNDGSMQNKVTILLENDSFNEHLDPSKYISMTKVPSGLIPYYEVIDEETLVITLKGKALRHAIGDNVTNSKIEIQAGLFQGGIKPDKIEDVTISFLGAPTVEYSGGFVENQENDGSVSGAVTITLEDDTFKEGLDLGDYIILQNLPSGLEPIYKLESPTEIILTLKGASNNHTNYNDINNLGVKFILNVLTKKVLPKNDINDIKIDFKDSPRIFINDLFKESSSNDGSIRNTVTLDLFGDNFTSINPNAKDAIVVKNLPDGLTPLFTRTKTNQLTMKLIGQTINHAETDDVENITITFSNQLFRNEVAPSPIEEVHIDFRDKPKISTKDKFIESSFNDGSFSDIATFTLEGDIFAKGKEPNDSIFVKNLPAGLTPIFTILNDNQIELKFTGNALVHDISSIRPILQFQDPDLFLAGLAPEDTILQDFNFVVAPQITLSEPFVESFENDGTIQNAVFLSVKGAKFNNINSDKIAEFIAISNLPSGLEPVFVKIDDQIQLTLTGAAVEHSNLYDVKDLRLEFSQELFDTKVSGNIINDGIINFREPPKVNTKSFVESIKNDGSIENEITLTINDDDEFTSVDLGDNIRVITPPDGLTPVFTYIDKQHILFKLDGTANDHANIHDLDNMTLEFDPRMFLSGQQADPVTNLVVDFKDPPPPVVEASAAFFEEADINDGSIKEAIEFSIQYDDLSETYKFKHYTVVDDIKAIIGQGTNLILNGQSIKDLDIDSPDFYSEIITKINNKGNGTGGIFAKLDGTKIKLFKDFENTIKVEGGGGTLELQNSTEKIKDEFTTSDMIGYFIDIEGLPKGLSPKFTKISRKLFSLTLEGQAEKHLNKDDTASSSTPDMRFTFKAGLFSRNVRGKDLNDLNINFNDPSVSFSSNFKENDADDGSIEKPITITLFGDDFLEVENLEELITTNNIPKGLKTSYKRLSDKKIEMTLVGNAEKHVNEDDVNNISISFSKDLFKQNLAIYPDTKLSIDFKDPPPAEHKAGGPGIYGGYLTFVSDKSNDLIIETNTGNFGLNDSKYFTTLNLNNAITKNLNKKDLYGIGLKQDIDYLLHEGGTIRGVTNKQSSAIVMDAVDSAIDYLRKLRAKVASYQNQVQTRVEYLNVQRINLRSAEANIREIDFAEETANFQKRDLLTQAGNYAISQANASKKMILSLLQS